MTQQMEILNSEQHRDLRIPATVNAHPHFVSVVLGELNEAATTCPLFFIKNSESGRFNLIALFGFQPGELLVEGADKGQPLFVPLEIVRRGFYAAGENIAIDRADPRFAQAGTLPLFDAMGEATDETRLIQRAIGIMVGARAATQDFIDAMVRHRLIEPIDVALSFDDGENLTLDGIYTISIDAMSELDDTDVVSLFRNGYLAAALCIQRSKYQIAVLARRRNDAIGAS